MSFPRVRRKSQFVLGLLLAVSDAGWAQPEGPAAQSKPATPGTCLSADETELARLVQQYRHDHGLPPIPLSKSLSLVAQWHAVDLEKNGPADQKSERGERCGLHSWSSKGPWSGFCYTADHREAKKVWAKPNELTTGKYPGMGFESVYFNGDGALAFRVLDYWKVRSEEKALLLETAPWPSVKWPALGVGIYGRYAVLWVGTVTDPLGTLSTCGTPSSTPSTPNKTGTGPTKR